VVLAHGVHLEPHEVDLLARTRTRICHCPGANLKLASGIADLPRLLAAGVPLALGADGPPCNNRLSAFSEMALAGTLHNLRYGPRAVSPWTVLALATREGARALHLGDVTGTLAPGLAADLIVVDGTAWSLQPGGDPASRLVYGGAACTVVHTVVGGRVLVRDRRLLSVNPAEIRERVGAATEATLARMKEWIP